MLICCPVVRRAVLACAWYQEDGRLCLGGMKHPAWSSWETVGWGFGGQLDEWGDVWAGNLNLRLLVFTAVGRSSRVQGEGTGGRSQDWHKKRKGQREPGEGQGTLGRQRGVCTAGQAQPAAPALSPLRGRPWRALPSSLLSESHSSRALRGANGALAAVLRLFVCLAGHQRKDCRAASGWEVTPRRPAGLPSARQMGLSSQNPPALRLLFRKFSKATLAPTVRT